ncbi:MAG: cytochrome c peroxidase [Phycisphaerales bacterium]
MQKPDAIVRSQGAYRSIKPLLLLTMAGLACVGGPAIAQALPPVPFPPENQFSNEKSTLGKILFWDEQLSSDNTMSCGTCHILSRDGSDPRLGINPGSDNLFGTADDILGSPGVAQMDADDKYQKSDAYGLGSQTTGRLAQPLVMTMYAPDLFWDGRASSQFIDPQTGDIVIATGGGLESQAVGPIVSSVEMSHEGRDWNAVAAKLERSRPLALASNLTPDLQAVIETEVSYPDLFAQAFGDDEITAARIGMAIATYERTLLPDQTPFDEMNAGNPNALTLAQRAGFNALLNSRCVICHAGPQFTNNAFRNVGLRPLTEDEGRFEVTGNNPDRGRFKVPSLRNVGLRDRFMHNGQLSTLEEVFDFYARRNGQVSFPQNRDPLLTTPIAFPPNVQANIIDFLTNGLTDQRVANETFPFDRPALLSEDSLPNPQIISTGIAGSGNLVPQMIAASPPNIGNADFKVGIDNALGGTQAWVVVSNNPPINGLLDEDELLGPITLEGSGAGEGFGTMPYPIDDIVGTDGTIKYMQWIVADASAPNGLSASPAAQLTIFCSMNGTCINHCPADLSSDGQLDFFDVSAFLNAFSSNNPAADFTGDGILNFFDVSAFLAVFSAGCP